MTKEGIMSNLSDISFKHHSPSFGVAGVADDIRASARLRRFSNFHTGHQTQQGCHRPQWFPAVESLVIRPTRGWACPVFQCGKSSRAEVF
tara:strand:- start:191 stop:460 length:270 start_codon:yes stop_codon:yes gene_type:complete